MLTSAGGQLLQSIGGILLAVLILLSMVSIHEFGHYVAGRILKFKINEFSVGFGPAIFKKRSKKTGELFAVRIIPLGGYCAFDGEDYDEVDAKAEAEKKEALLEEPFADFQVVEITESMEGVKNSENTENGGNTATVSELNKEKSKKTDEYPEPQGARFNDQAPWKRIIVLLAGALMNYLLALVLLIIMCFSYGVPMCIAIPVNYQGEELTPAEWTVETVATTDIITIIIITDHSLVTEDHFSVMDMAEVALAECLA